MNEMTKISLAQRACSFAAAKASFDDGRWCNLPPMVRESIMNKLADLLEQHADELAELEAIDNGKPGVKAALEMPDHTAPGLRTFTGHVR